jgi:putative transposase
MPQSLSNLLVHLVFSTKERFPFLRDPEQRSRMHHYLGGIVNETGQSLCIGGIEDHVHLLLALSRTGTIADLVRDLKRASTLWMKSENKMAQDFAWQNGYGAFSVGQLEVPLVKDYILQQERHHQKRTFQDEYRAFLVKYQIPHDERYLWD